MDLEPITFSGVQSDTIRVLEDGTDSRKIKYGVTLFFSNRPLAPGEKLVLNIHDSVLMSLLAVGFTEKDPRSLKLPIRRSPSQGFDEETGIRGPAKRDAGWIVGDAEALIYIEEDTNRVMIETDGSEPRELIYGSRIRKPVYLVFHQLYYGNPLVRISSRSDRQNQRESGDLHTMSKFGESFFFDSIDLRPARFRSFGPMGVETLSQNAASSDTASLEANFAFVNTPLGPDCALVVKLISLERSTPMKIILISEDARFVYSCGSLSELCDKTYPFMIESESLEAGDEIALRIARSGAVYISHNNRGWNERLHVDTDLTYHVVFDMENTRLLSILGIATDVGEF